jgi:outer membrane protein assembly factor BamB
MKAIDPKRYKVDVIPDVGYAGFTPCTDGRSIFCFFGDGVTARFDLAGNLKWARADYQPAVEHGFSTSPALVDGKLVTLMRGLTAIDAETGKLAWQTPICSEEGQNPANFTHASLIATTIGDTPVVVLGNNTIVRAADGKILWREAKGDNQSVPSPVIEGANLFQVTAGNSALTMRTLPPALVDPLNLTVARSTKIPLDDFPKHYLPWHLCSPLIHDGLAYLINNAGVLTVLDVDTGAVCYQKMLDLDVFQSHNEGAARGVGPSPVLAGGRIYAFGNNGAAVVLQPGRTFKQLAKNKLEQVVAATHWSERQERFVANPIVDGDRLILRGEDAVYSIGSR